MKKEFHFLFTFLRLIVVFTVLPLSLGAQTDTVSYIFIKKEKILPALSGSLAPITYPMDKLQRQFTYEPRYHTSLPYPQIHYFSLPLSLGEYRVTGVLKQFRHSALIGSGKQTNLISLGILNQATLEYYHSFNSRFSLDVQVNVIKFRTPFFSNQALGLGGTFLYKPRENIRFKVFGNYSLSSYPGMRTFQYGGTMAIDLSERFGTEIGVQRYFDPVQKRWETVPIVIPYYKFDNFTLGMDVGGIFYEILYHLIK